MTRLQNGFLSLLCLTLFASGSVDAAAGTPKIAFIDFKQCVEKSEVGKREQQKFEQLNEKIKEAMESKEKELSEVARLWNDPDHRDSLSPEAEEELSKRGNRLRMEYEEMRKRSVEMLQQANFQVVQTISAAVGKAAETVAAAKGYSMVMNKEACFFTDQAFDITAAVVAQMNVDMAAQSRETGSEKTARTSVQQSAPKENSNE